MHTPASNGSGRPPVRRGVVFAIVAAALVITTIDATIVATALHAIQHGLDTSVNWAGWTLTVYSFGLLLMLPLSGKLSERYGNRRVFLASVSVFTLASLACGFAGSIYTLIVLRAIQAAGGAGFTPSATGIIVEHFGKARDRAVGLFGSFFAAGAMIGPIFGGLFVSYWSWRGIFFVNVPIGIAVALLCLRFVPRDRLPKTREQLRTDVAGMALLGAGLLTGMLAVSYMGEPNAELGSAMFLAPIIVAAVSLSLFFRHIGRARQPFIDPQLIHGRGFGAVNLVNALFGGLAIGSVALIPLYATNRYGIGALDSGTLLTAQGAASILFSIVMTVELRRFGYRLPLFAGGAVMVVGIVLVSLPPPAGIPPYAWLAGAAFLIGVGTGSISPPSRNAGLQLAPEHSATIAALRTMGIQIGSITTISIATAIIAGSGDSGIVQAWFYVAAAAVLFTALPLITRVPEHRGAW